MALKTFAFLLAATGAALALYRLAERSPELAALPDQPDQPERLQDLTLMNAGLGSSANASNEDLLTPPSEGAAPPGITEPAGVPDLTRGP